MQPQAHVVIVGIDSYKDPRISHLNCAVADASAFFDCIETSIPKSQANLYLLTNQEATLKALRTTVGEVVARRTQPEDLVILFFAGHGSPETSGGVDETAR